MKKWLSQRSFKILIGSMTLFALSVGQTFAQRALPKMQGIQITGGSVNGFDLKNSFHTGIAVSVFNKHADQWVFGAEYLQKQFDYKSYRLPMAQFTAEGGYYYNFFSDGSKTIYLSLGASALAGYETTNWGDKQLPDGATLLNKDAFIYGGAVTLQVEVYLADRVILLANIRERVLWGGSFKKFNTQIGVGLKFIIN